MRVPDWGLTEIYRDYASRASLRPLATHHLVLPAGSRTPKAIICGEGPGGTEIQTGLPFTGRSGQRLRRHLEEAGLPADECWITNILKLRACTDEGKDRTPGIGEIRESMPYLWRELDLVAGQHTRVICAVGRTAASALLGIEVQVSTWHGKWKRLVDPAGVNWMVFVTFHPAYALRNPDADRALAEDLRKFASEVRETGPEALAELSA